MNGEYYTYEMKAEDVQKGMELQEIATDLVVRSFLNQLPTKKLQTPEVRKLYTKLNKVVTRHPPTETLHTWREQTTL